jgi:hypothetical protein
MSITFTTVDKSPGTLTGPAFQREWEEVSAEFAQQPRLRQLHQQRDAQQTASACQCSGRSELKLERELDRARSADLI